MKSLIVGLAVVGLAMSVNASDSHTAKVQQGVHSLIPMCPPGERAELVDVNGHYMWECVPID